MSTLKSYVTSNVISPDDRIRPDQITHAPGDNLSIIAVPSNLAGDIMQIRHKINLVSGVDFDQHTSQSLEEHVNDASKHVSFDKNLQAGEYIEEFRVVRQENGTAYVADHRYDSALGTIGICTNSTPLGGSAVIRTAGELVINGVNFTSNIVYLGENGELVETPPSTGYVIIIGRVLNNNTILIDIEMLYKT